ncbi:MAG: transglycosylase domain-containing protein, partial [Bdellovibrionales bacterium]|nr:transglycosylase domain-containing protein [Bdellovibrionales bacterium]
MFRRRLKIFLAIIGLILSFGTAALTLWLIGLDQEIQERLKGRRFQAPVEFFSAPIKLFKGQRKTPESLMQILKRRGLSESPSAGPGFFAVLEGAQCATALAIEDSLHSCIQFQFRAASVNAEAGPKVIAAFSAPTEVFQVYVGDSPEPQEVIEIPPELFAQFVGTEPILRTEIRLSEVPPLCLHAILAIEDSNFLEH